MPKGGLEPPRPREHNALNVACLPISPLRLKNMSAWDVYNNTGKLLLCQELFRQSVQFIYQRFDLSFAKKQPLAVQYLRRCFFVLESCKGIIAHFCV